MERKGARFLGHARCPKCTTNNIVDVDTIHTTCSECGITYCVHCFHSPGDHLEYLDELYASSIDEMDEDEDIIIEEEDSMDEDGVFHYTGDTQLDVDADDPDPDLTPASKRAKQAA